MRIVSAAAAAAAAILFTAGSAFAFDREVAREASSDRVDVAGVDFRDAAQVRALHERLQQSALFVCGVSNDGSRGQRDADRACAERAVREAVQKIDRPLLTAAYQQSGAPMVARGY